MCKCVCIHVHSERNKLRNLVCMCVCVCLCVRTSADTKRKYRADIILRVRDGAAVCLCVEPHVGETARRENGWTSWGRGKRKFPAARVCVSLSPPPPSYIPTCTYTDAHCTTVVALSTSFPARSLYSMNIYTYIGTRHFTPTIPALYSFAERTYTHGGSHLSALHMAKLS